MRIVGVCCHLQALASRGRVQEFFFESRDFFFNLKNRLKISGGTRSSEP